MEVESQIRAFYAKAKEQFPSLHCLTLTVMEYADSLEPKLQGFYHLGDDCKNFDDISEIYNLLRRHEILFRNFGGER